jgi:hypothetical protein
VFGILNKELDGDTQIAKQQQSFIESEGRKDCDTVYSRGTCTPMFIAALFTIAKLWKQP